jgi:iron only hydrogenase large subunit-like protein
MGCVGGCINGGGQPIVKAKDFERIDIIKERSKVLYTMDQKAILRKSHLNPAVQKLYSDFLNKMSQHDLHDLLHTHYKARAPYSKYID